MLPTISGLEFPGLELKRPSHHVSVTGALPATGFPAALRLLRALLQPWEAALLQTPPCRRVCGHGEPHVVVAECPQELSAQKERKATPDIQPWAGIRFGLSQMRERHQQHIPVLRMGRTPLSQAAACPPVSSQCWCLLPRAKIMGRSHIPQIPGHPAAPSSGGELEPSTNEREPQLPPDSFPAPSCVELSLGGTRARFQCAPRGTLRSHGPGSWQGVLAKRVNEE